MIFSKSIIANGRLAQEQWKQVIAARKAYRANELTHSPIMRASGLNVNEGLIPQDVYQEFDNVTVTRMRADDGDTFLNDLMPLSKSISIGKLTHKFRRASDAGNAQTSMTGQIGVRSDKTDYSYDGSIVPIHDTGFGREWREWNAQTSEGFDALIDDQRESVESLRSHLADTFMSGHTDNDGNIIVVDGLSWSGMTADSRIAAIDLGAGGVNFDFTDTAQSYANIELNFKEIRDTIYITNNCTKDLVYYVSREIMSNFERNSSESYSSEKIMNRLAQLMGVAAIKVTNKLSGNKMMGFPLDGSVRPIVGMGLNTVAMPRPLYNSNYDFVVWGAIGWEVRNDYSNRKCAFYATA